MLGIGVCITWYSPGGRTSRSQLDQNENTATRNIRYSPGGSTWFCHVLVVRWLHMCIRCCMCVVYVCAYVREVFSHLLSILYFAVRQLLCWPFLFFMTLLDVDLASYWLRADPHLLRRPIDPPGQLPEFIENCASGRLRAWKRVSCTPRKWKQTGSRTPQSVRNTFVLLVRKRSLSPRWV